MLLPTYHFPIEFLPKYQAPLSFCLRMPGPHLELKLMKTFEDVGGCDIWMGSFWAPRQQWWVGWHTPKDIDHWTWPSDEWLLIGWERWYQPINGKSKLLEAYYNTPNPSTTLPPCSAPDGHWHMTWSHRGNLTWSAWHEGPLLDDSPHYLKGGRTGPKGEFRAEWRTKGKAKGKSTGQ